MRVSKLNLALFKTIRVFEVFMIKFIIRIRICYSLSVSELIIYKSQFCRGKIKDNGYV